MAIRPEAVRVLETDATARVLETDATAATDHVVLPAVVEAVALVGSQVNIHLRLGGSDAAFVVTSNQRQGLPAPGDHLRVTWSLDDARVLAG